MNRPPRELSVLIVDDNAADRSLYRVYLQQASTHRYSVLEAEDGPEGLRILKTENPDCMLLDYGLPGLNGLEVLDQMLAEYGRVPLPVIMLTGYADEAMAWESLRRGAQDFLVKDRTTPTYLDRAVQNALQKFVLFLEKESAEEALRESEARFRNAFSRASIGMCVADAADRLLEVNPAYCEITGYEPAELLGKTFTELTHPEDRWKNGETHQKLLAGEIPGYVIEKRYIRKSGDIVWVRNSICLVRRFEGGAETMALSENISERRHLEEQLLQAQKMEAVGRLAGGVAHDFNNLLTVILGYADVLQGALGPGSDLAHFVSEINEAGQRAAALTQQLLAFSRRQILQPKVQDFNPIVQNMHRLVARLLGEDVRVQMTLDPGVNRVKVDSSQIEQVVMNLAINARDAMPHGGVLHIETAPVELDAATAAGMEITAGKYVRLTVSDTGAGMDVATMERVFEPFFTTKEAGKGTGLGLATVYGIIRQSGGGISVDSQQGRGTTFRVYLPESTEPPSRRAPEGTAAESTTGGTILLVEDEPGVRALLLQALLGAGYRVLEASCSEEALRIGAEHGREIDLLLTDVVLPDLHGPDLRRKMAELTNSLKVLYVSGYAEQTLTDGVDGEGTGFLQKPFTIQDVLQKVNGLLHPQK